MAVTERILAALPVSLGGATIVASPWLVTGEDFLRVEVYSANFAYPVGLHWRMLTPARTIQVFSDSLVSDASVLRKRTAKDFQLGTGLLLNVGLIGLGTPVSYGHLYGRVTLNRGKGAASVLLGTILSDYITARWGIGWPGSPIRLPNEGQRTYIHYATVTPAAGTELGLVVPDGARWELISFCALFTADPTVINRRIRLILDDGGASGTFWHGRQAAESTANDSSFWRWAQGCALGERLVPPDFAEAGLPMQLAMPAGSRILTQTNDIQVGDQWGPAHVFVRETLEDVN